MVVDYRADGTARLVTRGWADPQNARSMWKTADVVPGAYNTISFDLQPHDYLFAAGSRVGVVVMSSDRLFTLRPPPGTELTLIPSLSFASLPLVGGADAFAAAVN
jgi:X-Pro dipeptidyl-peptidase